MCFLVSVTIGSVLIYREKSATEEAAKEKLLLTVEKQGLEYDKVLTEVETATAKLENVFLSNFNFKDYNNNKDGYVEEFNKRNENYVKTFAETDKRVPWNLLCYESRDLWKTAGGMVCRLGKL
ncbi:hypothetical protein [Clostridium sp. BL8]|uniref:hypothetical protein n=1 Tax=Clostridium sp. BL8 TaxID=1354301 RepID=UPI001268B4B8|nr:hypothetical protein [Clostridium sp. BL8]